MPNIWSPEHFLVAAVESCLMTTFLAIAENSKLEFISFKSTAIGKLDKVEGKFQMTEIILKPVLEITDENNAERAKRIIEKSEKACLISNSIKTKITLESEIVIASVGV
ncbi:OsmC family protein [Salegentibacter salarius]|uniref:OsmC family protein n=1 Tax=Salegentibacter salarius TaxID=435906 RepID=UPI0009C725B4|nr:OsmC family protein [Salegentibacter salarius]SLJ95178.1 peroxiredoxin, SACOL1771 subfamily [Salegentibacter salarius]